MLDDTFEDTMKNHGEFTIAKRRALTGALGVLSILTACDAGVSDDDDDPGIGIVSVGDDGSSSGESIDDSGDDSADDGTETDDGIRYCGEAEIAVQAVAPRIMLVLDKSHSMVTSSWDHDGDASTAATTRWYSLHEAVADLVTDIDGTTELGAVLFPSRLLDDNDAATACEVPSVPDVEIGAGHGQAILDALPDADSLAIWGGTPTSAGIVTATEALRALPGDAPRAIVLVTDGAANCSADASPSQAFSMYDENLAPLVAGIADEGIPTYVIGIDIIDGWVSSPQANPHERLSEVALAGGVASDGDAPYYNTRDEAELFDALAEITGRIQCTVALDDLPGEPERVNLTVDGLPVDYVPACDAAGWRYGDGGEIELCASTCDDFVGGATLESTFDCIPEG